MAQEIKTFILMPSLDSEMGSARLQLYTHKGFNGGIAASASVHYLKADGCIAFEVFGDFSKVIARRPGTATQKALNALHVETFTPETVEAIKTTVTAFYAAKNKAVA